MPIFYQQNQQFKTIDILVMFSLVGVVASAGGAVLAKSFEDERPTRARTSAEAIALQLFERVSTNPGESSVKGTNERGPASVLSGQKAEAAVGAVSASASETGLMTNVAMSAVPVEGEIGKDPWNKPFHYLILQNESHRRIVVWSDGPNQKSESMELIRKNARERALPEDAGLSSRQLWSRLFGGDDVGFVYDR